MAIWVVRRGGTATGISLIATAVASSGALASCYPDFQFGATASSTSATSSTGAVRPGTGGAGSTSATTTGKTTSATTTTKSSSASAPPMLGPPCGVTEGTCPFGQACCFDTTVPPNDHCGTTCGSTFLTLHCTTDAECATGKHCCAIVDGLGSFTSTSCRTDCSASDAFPACDPTANNTCSCTQVLGSYYQSGTAKAPYDQYGQCN